MSSFNLEHYEQPGGTDGCSPAEPKAVLAVISCGCFSFLGFFYGFTGLLAAQACRAHPSDWVQPCPDTITGPLLPAAIIGLLSTAHACALGPSVSRYRITS